MWVAASLHALSARLFKLHPPVLRLAIALGVFLRGSVRGVPRDEEAVPFLPNVLPNVGVIFPIGGAASLENGWAAIGRDLNLTRGVAEEEREGHGLSLHHAAAWGQHLSDTPNFVHLAVFEGARNNSGDNNPRARVVGGARGVSSEDQVGCVHSVAWAPNP